MVNRQKQLFYVLIGKRVFDVVLSLGLVLFFLPLALVISLAIWMDSYGPVFFTQRRTGKHGSSFLLFKFRTMIPNADERKQQYSHLNEADGPVFKIWADPRFTSFGRLLAHTGFDELPQLMNVLIGEMSLVGPRPLPVDEAKKIQMKTRKLRESVLPGITSSWVVLGSHQLSFKQWMELDCTYSQDVTFWGDFMILLRTAKMILRFLSKPFTS